MLAISCLLKLFFTTLVRGFHIRFHWSDWLLLFALSLDKEIQASLANHGSDSLFALVLRCRCFGWWHLQLSLRSTSLGLSIARLLVINYIKEVPVIWILVLADLPRILNWLFVVMRWDLNALLTLLFKQNELFLLLHWIQAASNTSLLPHIFDEGWVSGRHALWRAVWSCTEVERLFLSLHLLSHLHVELNLVLGLRFHGLALQFIVDYGRAGVGNLFLIVYNRNWLINMT